MKLRLIAAGIVLSVIGGRVVDKIHYDSYCRSYHFDGVCPPAQCALNGTSFRGNAYTVLHPYFACQVRGWQNGGKITLVIEFKDAPMWEVEAVAAHASLKKEVVEVHQSNTVGEPTI